MLNTKNIPSIFIRSLGLLFVLNFILFSLVDSAKSSTTPKELANAFLSIAEKEAGGTKTDNSDFGLPTHRRDGGSRGSRDNCVADAQSQNLMALIPEDTVGANASASPKLFFYVPEIKQQRTLEFVLRNEQDELIYEAFFTTEGDGIMSVEVPADISSNSLEANQNYHWYLSMICDIEQRSRDIVVEGWMRQATIDLATKDKLDTVNSAKQAEIYQEKGLWYDALSVLAENQDSAAEQSLVRKKWSEMLTSVGLQELASKSFIDVQIVDQPADSLSENRQF